MGLAVITIKLMMKDVSIDFRDIAEKAKKKINKIFGDVGEIKVEEEPIAFGLMALNIMFAVDEKFGTEKIENSLKRIKGVASANVIDYRRAFG